MAELVAATEGLTVTPAAKVLPPDRTTYNDFQGKGAALPDLSSLKFIKGEAPKLDAPIAVLFWAKFAKGDYRTMVHFSLMMRKIPALQVVGISCDPDFEDCESMLKKMNTAMPTQSIDELIFDMSLAFDEGTTLKKAFGEFGTSPSPGFAFLFGKDGKLAWKETFTSSWTLEQGQFAEQCALLLADEPLLDNGPAPEEEEDEGEEVACVGALDIPGAGDDGDY